LDIDKSNHISTTTRWKNILAKDIRSRPCSGIVKLAFNQKPLRDDLCGSYVDHYNFHRGPGKQITREKVCGVLKILEGKSVLQLLWESEQMNELLQLT
jgi:hypothetical protein